MAVGRTILFLLVCACLPACLDSARNGSSKPTAGGIGPSGYVGKWYRFEADGTSSSLSWNATVDSIQGSQALVLVTVTGDDRLLDCDSENSGVRLAALADDEIQSWSTEGEHAFESIDYYDVPVIYSLVGGCQLSSISSIPFSVPVSESIRLTLTGAAEDYAYTVTAGTKARTQVTAEFVVTPGGQIVVSSFNFLPVTGP